MSDRDESEERMLCGKNEVCAVCVRCVYVCECVCICVYACVCLCVCTHVGGLGRRE